MTHTNATPKESANWSILRSLPVMFTMMAAIVACVIVLAATFYFNKTYDIRLAERLSQVSSLIAPDVAWRETDRLKHVLDVELGGNALVLDENGMVLTGNKMLLDAPRSRVMFDGQHVGYLIAPNAEAVKVPMPLWLVIASCLFGIVACLATAMFVSARIRRAAKTMTDYVGTLGARGSGALATAGGLVEFSGLEQAVTQSTRRARKEIHRLRKAAFTDPITGLPNLNHLRDFIEARTAGMTVERPGAYVLLDLDGFVRASESLGPGKDGDLLIAAVERMQTVLEDYGSKDQRMILASLQSDNFALFISHCDGGREYITSILRRLNRAFEAPIGVGSRLVTLGVSAGVTMLPEDGTSAAEVHRHAATALRESRKKSPNTYQFYAPRFDRVAKGRFQLEAELRDAVRNAEFIPVFQPKIDFSSGQIKGAEALARWHREGGKVVMPGTFIGVAEEIGLIEEIGQQILVASCQAAAEWNRHGYAIPVAVNVSPRQFARNNFAKMVIHVLEMTKLPPHLLELEVTESMAVEDPQKVTQVMHPLREMGVGLAIDDFGTGHSNLATLTQLPFDVFKIDRQFVSALQKDRQAPAIVEMILAMAETLGMKTVAEGVETEQQAEFLRKRGCTLGQGFLYSPGISNEKFIALLRGWRGNGVDVPRRNLG